MADEQICIHTPQGMVCYRNASQKATAQKLSVKYNIYCTTVDAADGAPLNPDLLEDTIDPPYGKAKLDLLFKRSKQHPDVVAKLAQRGVNVDDWHTITRMHK